MSNYCPKCDPVLTTMSRIIEARERDCRVMDGMVEGRDAEIYRLRRLLREGVVYVTRPLTPKGEESAREWVKQVFAAVGEATAAQPPTFLDVQCQGCGAKGTSKTFMLEEGDRWECPTCWEKYEAIDRQRAADNSEVKHE